ncbi:MAG: hypothetical protein U0X40_11050 [Ferruginibacter sp.]
MLKKDSFTLGAILGFIGPILGILLFKLFKFQIFSFKETFQFMYYEPGHRTFTVALSLALLVNAVLFTVYINARKDKTAKGIFALTLVYGLLVLSIKTFS